MVLGIAQTPFCILKKIARFKMIVSSYKVWAYKFNVAELKEMMKNADDEDLTTLGLILDEVEEFGDKEEIFIETGDETKAFSSSLSELETDTEDIIGFLQTQDFDNADQWS
jgi:hypothetical protein